MGKTVPAYRMALEEEISRWNGFARALRKDDREAFEELMDSCRNNAMAAGDWVPLIAQQYLTITWNYASGTILQPGASQTITITINVNQYVTDITTFTNTIYIIATQSP
jgi:hypothetical protein